VVVVESALVVVDAAVVGGDSGESASARSSPGRTSLPGTGAAESPDMVATDTGLGEPMSAFDTASAESTRTTLVSAANSIRGDERLAQVRCTVSTSRPPDRRRGHLNKAPRPQPVKLLSSLSQGWWPLPTRINRPAKKNFFARRSKGPASAELRHMADRSRMGFCDLRLYAMSATGESDGGVERTFAGNGARGRARRAASRAPGVQQVP
jgi:hypothetical protein